MWWAAEVPAWLERRRASALAAARAAGDTQQPAPVDDAPAVGVHPFRSRTGVATATVEPPVRGDVV